MSTRAGAVSHEAQTSRIPDLMAGNINRWQRWRLNRHLGSCAPCREELERYRRIEEGLAETVPTYLAENRPSDAFMERVRHTIATHPMPAPRRSVNLPRVGRLAVPAVTAVLAVIAIVVALTLTSGNGASALSLATPVRGTMSITQGGELVADGTFGYISLEQWKQSTTYYRTSASIRFLSSGLSANGATHYQREDGHWNSAGVALEERQPIAGLAELGLTGLLFHTVLDMYQLSKEGETEFQGEQLSKFVGIDSGHASRMQASSLAAGATDIEAAELFDFYEANPPNVLVLANDEGHIRSIFITVSLTDVPDPMLVEVIIREFNAELEITSPES